jgi:uncharacterized protein (TIGR03435 family)
MDARCAIPVLLIFTGAAMAQPDARPQFEVASIKPAAPGAPGFPLRISFGPGGTFTATNFSLKDLIANAWDLEPYQISGGPAWLDSARFNISAKAERSPKGDEARLMEQSLLANRFQLVMHRETKEHPIYALVLEKKDGKLGARLTQSKEGNCKPRDPSVPIPRPEAGKPPALPCGMLAGNPRSLRAAAVPLAELAKRLSGVLGRTVIDQTGLTGDFDFILEWTPDESQFLQLPPGAPKPPPEADPVSIFTAIQEQLGLRLESRKGPVETFVIDRAEKPSEN